MFHNIKTVWQVTLLLWLFDNRLWRLISDLFVWCCKQRRNHKFITFHYIILFKTSDSTVASADWQMNGMHCSSLIFHECALTAVCNFACSVHAPTVKLLYLTYLSGLSHTPPFEWPSLQWSQTVFIIIYVIFSSPPVFNLQAVRSCNCLCSMWTV